jgi:hypothetical protein
MRRIMKKYIEFKDVSKVYKIGEKEYVALDNISFHIEKNEFVVILGPSGAGKSTILNLLGGMDNPTSGEIYVDSNKISDYNDNELTKYRGKDVGFIFQFYNILPSLTCLENVEIVKDVTNTKKNPKKVLEEVGLINHLDKFPNELSGGEQQRVSIGRAVAKEPKILLCDEPTGALDSYTGVEIIKLLKKQKDTTVIVVTHNSLIAEVADRVIRVKNGHIESNTKNKNIKNVDEVKW